MWIEQAAVQEEHGRDQSEIHAVMALQLEMPQQEPFRRHQAEGERQPYVQRQGRGEALPFFLQHGHPCPQHQEQRREEQSVAGVGTYPKAEFIRGVQGRRFLHQPEIAVPEQPDHIQDGRHRSHALET